MYDPDDETEPTRRGTRRRYTLGTMLRYVWHNRLKAVRDAVAALFIALAVATVFGSMSLPTWTFYVALLLALVGYNHLVEPWKGLDEDR